MLRKNVKQSLESCLKKLCANTFSTKSFFDYFLMKRRLIVENRKASRRRFHFLVKKSKFTTEELKRSDVLCCYVFGRAAQGPQQNLEL